MASESAYEEPAERARIEALLSGSPAALDAWFRAEHPQVYRLCFGFLADAAEAEDAAQDAMLKLHDNLAARDPGRPYRPWRNALVLNACRDRLRRREARARAEEGACAAEAFALRARTVPEPADDLAAGELRALLHEALASLTPREREVFVLRDLEEQPTADVAASLDITESSVRSLLTLARRRLRGLLGERLGGSSAEGGARA